MDMNFIDEMIKDITNEKKILDEIAFLKFLKEELDRQGIELTVIRQPKPLIGENLITSDITGVQLDLSEHDKKKNAKIQSLEKQFYCMKSELSTTRTEKDRLKGRIRELEESQEVLPIEPIKVADYLISRKGKPNGQESICELANHFPIYSNSGLREIAEHLLVYWNYAEEK